MYIEVALLISVISVAFAVYSGIKNLNRNKSADDRKEASDMTTILVKLENIGKDTSEIKNDIRSVKDDVKSNTLQITRHDESLKAAWKAINKLQNKDGGEPHVD